MVKEITIKWWVTLKEFNMKEKLKELLSIPTKTWEEERLIKYLIGHFEEKGYKYEKDDLGNLYVTKGISDYYPFPSELSDLNVNPDVLEWGVAGSFLLLDQKENQEHHC